MSKKQTPQPFIRYAPEVEANRADYATVAEIMIKMIQLRAGRPYSGTLDVFAPGWTGSEPDNHIFYDAIEEHLRALFENLLVTYGDDFLRTIYVEMRLYYDQQMFGMKGGRFEGLRRR